MTITPKQIRIEDFVFTRVLCGLNNSERSTTYLEKIDSFEYVETADGFFIKISFNGTFSFLSSLLDNGLMFFKTQKTADEFLVCFMEVFDYLRERYDYFVRGELYAPKGTIYGKEITKTKAWLMQKLEKLEKKPITPIRILNEDKTQKLNDYLCTVEELLKLKEKMQEEKFY